MSLLINSTHITPLGPTSSSVQRGDKMWKPIDTIPKDGGLYCVVRINKHEYDQRYDNCDIVYYSMEPAREFGDMWWSTVTSSNMDDRYLLNQYTHWTELPKD